MKLLITVIAVLFLVGGVTAHETKTLSWEPVTTNVDGTPITNLAGYKVYIDNKPPIETTETSIELPAEWTEIKVTAYKASGVESEPCETDNRIPEKVGGYSIR